MPSEAEAPACLLLAHRRIVVSAPTQQQFCIATIKQLHVLCCTLAHGSDTCRLHEAFIAISTAMVASKCCSCICPLLDELGALAFPHGFNQPRDALLHPAPEYTDTGQKAHLRASTEYVR